MSWRSVQLSDVAANIQTGPFGSQLHQSDYSEIGIPVVMPKDLIGGKISQDSIARVSEEHVQRLCRHIIQKNDILYSRRGDVGRCALATDYEVGWLCGTGCLRVTIDESKANPKFIFYQLQQPTTVGWVEKHAVGATMLNLNTTILGNVPLWLPQMDVQNHIADILSAYDDLIANNRKQITLLEEAAQRLYKEWFVDLRFPGYEHSKIVDGVPEGWKKERLVDIADVQYGYAFDSSQFNSKKLGTPIIRIRNIPESQTEDYTTEAADPQYMVYNGDIVVGMDGEFHINSWAGDTAYLVQRTCRIKPLHTDLNGFLLWAIHEPIKYFEQTVVGATVAHLGKKHMDTIRILVPSEKFYMPFKMIFDKRLKLMNENEKLKEAREHLLPRLMSGKVEE